MESPKLTESRRTPKSQVLFDKEPSKKKKNKQRSSLISQKEQSGKIFKRYLSNILSDLDEDSKIMFEEIQKTNKTFKKRASQYSFSKPQLIFSSPRKSVQNKRSSKILSDKGDDTENENILEIRKCPTSKTKKSSIFHHRKSNISLKSTEKYLQSSRNKRVNNKFLDANFSSCSTVRIIGGKNEEGSMPMSPKKMSRFNNLCSKLKKNLTLVNEDEGNQEEIFDSLIPEEKDFTVIEDKNIKKEIEFRHLFHKEGVYDSLSDGEEEEEIEKYNNDSFINPLSKKKLFFDLFVFLTTITLILVIPIQVFLKHSNNKKEILSYFSIAGDFVFFCDMIVSFFTAYFDYNDNLVTSNKKITFHYLSSFFILDLICSIPFGTYFEISSKFSPKSTSMKEMLKFINFFKIFKFSNNAAVDIIFFSLITSKIGTHVVIILTISFFILIIHVLSSIFIIIGLNNDESWITLNFLERSEIAELYINSFYFICVTIFGVGYGDYKTNTLTDRLFLMMLLIFGVFLNSWLVSALIEYGGDIKLKGNKEIAINFKKNVGILNEIKRLYDEKKEVCLKIERFLVYNFNQKIINSNELLDSLPNSLKCELFEIMYKSVIHNFIFFKNFKNRDFVVEVISNFIPALFVKNDRIINQGDTVEEMIFVKSGKLSVELPLPAALGVQIKRFETISHLNPTTSIRKVESIKSLEMQYTKLIEIHKNEHYGDIQMFLNQKTDVSVRVSTKISEIFLLKKTDAIKISNNFPEIWKMIIAKSVHNIKIIKKIIKKVLNVFYENNHQMLQHLYNIHQLGNKSTETEDSSNGSIEKKNSEINSPIKVKKNQSGPILTVTNYEDTENRLLSQEDNQDIQRTSTKKINKFFLTHISTKNDESNKTLTRLTDDFLISESEQNESKANLLQRQDENESGLVDRLGDLDDSVCKKENGINNEFRNFEEQKIFQKLATNTSEQSKITNKKFNPLFHQYPYLMKEQKVENFYLRIGSSKTIGHPKIKKNRSSKKTFKSSKFLSAAFIPTKKSPLKNVNTISSNKSGQSLNLSTSNHSISGQSIQRRRSSVFFNYGSGNISSTHQILMSIGNNIEDNSMNLNDPKSFYSNKFNDLIKSSTKNNDNKMNEKLNTFFSMNEL